MKPVKRLLTNEDLELWKNSSTFKDLVDFITNLALSVEGRENTDYKIPISESVNKVAKILDDIDSIFIKHPVINQRELSRFGKLEFRDFYDDLSKNANRIISSHIPELTIDQLEELSTYLIESWGNRQRIDYGSGHELNFLCFLYGLTKYNILHLDQDNTNIILKLFIQYMSLMRKLEKEYWLEPAGSHGVWGLDDYHFLPFLFGAFQLSTHKHLKPSSIHNDEVVEMFASKYLYFGCISFINSVKTTATLRWHSPMLDDISGVKKWSKVAEGMIKMYKAEVLSKLPIMQHFFFSDFLPCPEGVSPPEDPEKHEHGECGHHHEQNSWGDCCGIKVPSAIAATEMNKKKTHTARPLPFD
ncbi:probable Serine/threonine-protein phosphatase 2A activator 2 [Saccharomycodes ludwigii]|uniref:Serine/threonine-protein phosphatase 2A activator n=1 Tax=Saccharomycodes ludwigii TaxID=36035 RepID=A0A376B1L2_9ASCO|nr:hypothetical protein SCDLUD_002155 [Saccharomycodes ludwigii]KAH3902335.1 hypothetical protein SCDLUD_002155 [Saccharomycodes ludwigii]SSD58531.1 probable Serine/threonine-protein phosphatase 2A activator 2 [Saccharomycodes ludwigii]